MLKERNNKVKKKWKKKHCFKVRPNDYLEKTVEAFYNSDYQGGGNWKIEGRIENTICTLKNDITSYRSSELKNAAKKTRRILKRDLPKILKYTKLSSLTVCVVPRAKVTYKKDQLLFKSSIRKVAKKLNGFEDGTDFIIRYKDTRTTHRNRSGHGGNGKMPYEGITKESCKISKKVKGNNILLIDDLYTKSINIDEDAIQALFDRGANKVYFYSIGKTVR